MDRGGGGTARSVEDETRNDRRNANRNPEWWGVFSQLVEIEKLKFLCISRYKFKLRFWLNLNFFGSPGTNSNLMLGVQLTKISPPFRISICISTIISSLTFHGTGCNMMMPRAQVILQQYDVWCKDAFCAGYSTALISFSSGQYLHFNCRIALKNCGRLDLYDKTISLI